jgi:(2R)-sulfolactate sulfo-lyase subunit alpha
VIDFLVHDERDTVGVAVVDIPAGRAAKGATLDGRPVPEIVALHEIPLGHKIARAPHAVGGTVIKYGHDIGRVVAAIGAGELVHTHNLKTKRW